MWPFRNLQQMLVSIFKKERNQDEQILDQLKNANEIFKRAISLEATQSRISIFKDERKGIKWPTCGWFILRSASDITEFKGYLHEIFVLLNIILKEAQRIESLSNDVVRRINKAKYGDELPRAMNDILAPAELEIISYCRNLETKIKENLELLQNIIQKGSWYVHSDVNIVPFNTYWSQNETNNWIIYLRSGLPVLESNFEKLLELIKKTQTEIAK